MPRPVRWNASISQATPPFPNNCPVFIQEYNIDDDTGWDRTREPSALTFASHIRFSHDLELLAAPEILFPGLYHGLLTAMKRVTSQLLQDLT